MTLDGVGHGTLLAGRYRLEERVRTGADGSLWRAVDETLDRPVSVRVVRPGHRYTADVIDAARRAALVEDARLVRVLDVGESGGSAYIVSEHLVGRTLEELLANGPLPAETVRRLVGEAAQALDRASTRGLHHLQLTPSSLVVTGDGTVKVLGTAVEAALAGVEHEEDPLGADRLDAVGLVRVIYAGLTGRWPGQVDGPLGPAPRVTGRAVPPGDLVPGIPNDLDTLCSVTLGPHDDGPHSPGELAEQLAPWASAEPLTSPRAPVAAPLRPAPDGVGPERPSTAPAATTTSTAPTTSTTTSTDSADSTTSAAAVSVSAAGTAETPSARVMRHATPERGVSAGEPVLPTLLPREAQRVGVSAGSTGSAAGTNGTTRRDPVGTGAGTAVGGPTTGGHRVPHPDGVDDWALLSRHDPARRTDRPDDGGTEPLGPFIPPAPVSRPPRDQARFVLAIVAGLVVLGLILAVFSLRGLFGVTDPLVQPAPLIPPSAASTTATRSGPAAPPPSASASSGGGIGASASPVGSASGTPADVSGIQAIDPQGDGNESGSTADRAIDGDASTTWRSDRYQSAAFGGLKKGLGLYLELSGDSVTSVTVEMPGRGGVVELRTARGPGLDSSAVVATANAQGGRAVLTPVQPVTGGPLLLWFTELPQQDSGEYRLVVSEISVT